MAKDPHKLDGTDQTSDSSNIYGPNDWADRAPFQFDPFNSVTMASLNQGHGPHDSPGQGHGPHGSPTLTYDQVSSAGSALKINLIWESSVANAPAAFQADMKAAAAYLTTQFHDDTTVNITVGYGTIDGFKVGGSSLGESITNLVDHVGAGNQLLTGASLISDLKSDEVTDGANVAVPDSDPTNGGHFWVTTAQAKALGLGYNLDPHEAVSASTNGGAATTLNVDGHVGFSSARNEFDYSTTAQGDTVTSGQYDFYGTALHEMTEVMGRMLFAGTNVNGAANSYEPLDLFRFSSANTPDTSSTKGGYFSIDNGQTHAHTFNGTSGDYGDWAVAQQPADAFNASGTPGQPATDHGALSQYDLQTMDAIGWDHIA